MHTYSGNSIETDSSDPQMFPISQNAPQDILATYHHQTSPVAYGNLGYYYIIQVRVHYYDMASMAELVR